MSAIDYAQSRETLNKTIADLGAEQKALAERGDSLAKNLDLKINDVMAAVRGMQAAQIAANAPRYDGPDAYLADFVEKDERAVERGGCTTVKSYQHPQATENAYVNLGTANEAVRWRGVTHEDGSYDPGLLDSEPESPWHAKLQQLVDRRSFVRSLQSPNRKSTPALDRQLKRHLARAPGVLQKIFADASTIGGEWIPDNMMPQLEKYLALARRVEALFQTFTIPAGGSALVPFLTTGVRPFLAGAAAADDPAQFSSSSMTTAQRTVTAVKLAVRMQVDRDATEDSLVNFESVGREAIVQALVDGSEDALLNGDTAATHGDTGISAWNIRSRWGTSNLGGTGDHRRAWIGLRQRAIDVSATTDMSATETTAGFNSLRGSLAGAHGLSDVVAITSPEWLLIKMLAFAEVLTVDKFGPQATVLSGQLGSLSGVPIIVSEFMDKELNASGVYDDTTKTKTGLVIFDRSRFRMGLRRGARVEVSSDITRDLLNYVATERKVFYTFDAAATKNVAYGYKLSTS